MIIKTLNFGVPGDGAVNVFEFMDCEASRKIKHLLDEEDYDNAGILDRKFKLGPRQSPLFQSEGMRYIWDEDFTLHLYKEKAIERIQKEIDTNPSFCQSLIKDGKIDISAKQSGTDESELLSHAVRSLVYFDAMCAMVIRETMTWEEFETLHESASRVVQNTIMSIVEELRRPEEESEMVFFLQEVNAGVLDALETLIKGTHRIAFNDEKTTAIIYPESFHSTPHGVECIAFPKSGDTFLHEEICILHCNRTFFISVHLSAKTKAAATKEGKTIFKNMEDQLMKLKNFVVEIAAQNVDVIVGGDFNHRVTPELFETTAIFPLEDVSTTYKERSYLQVQFKKAGKLDKKSKDAICFFGDFNFKDCRVRSLYRNGKTFCSYALDANGALMDKTVEYPSRLTYPDYERHFPDHDLVEVCFSR